METKIRDYYNCDSRFDRANVFWSECSEGCKLNGDLSEYLILNGDEIKTALNLQDIGSADCILIDKNDIDGKYKIIICELSTNKPSKKVIKLIEKRYNVEYSYKQVWEIATKKLGLNYRKPY